MLNSEKPFTKLLEGIVVLGIHSVAWPESPFDVVRIDSNKFHFPRFNFFLRKSV